MQGVGIRSAVQADRPAIRDVTFAAYDEYRDALGPDAWQLYAANIASTLESADPGNFIVAVRDGTIVGSVLLFPASRPSSTHPEVRLLSVPPGERGHGIGQALMDECKRRALAAGATHLSLHTTRLMQAALRMYERMGFERTPETDFRPAPDFVVMGFRLRLTGESTMSRRN